MSSGSKIGKSNVTINNKCTVGDFVVSIGTNKTWNGPNSPKVNGKLQLTENPYFMQKSIAIDDSVKVVYGHNPDGSPKWFFGTVWSCFGWEGSPPDPGQANTELGAYSDLVSNIREHDFNLAVSVAEAKDTFALIGDTARTIALSLKLLKSGRSKEALRALIEKWTKISRETSYAGHRPALDAVFSQWMGMQYAWKPLLNDVHEASVALAKHLSTEPPQRKYRGKKTLRNKGKTDQTLRKRKCKIKVVLSTNFKLQTELGLSNPALLAWELLPLSFVADWFIPIGSFLDVAGSIPDLSFEKYCKTDSDENSNGMQLSALWGGGGQNAKLSSFTLNRSVASNYSPSITDIPFPRIRPLSNLDSWAHAVTSIAILNNVVRK